MAELTYRARRILYATVTEYISTGEPVGSRKLSKRYGINLSPATIRNVLADLEDLGYVQQPHTSAGRVPTERGFRVFVDALVQMREVTAEDRAAVLDRLQHLAPGTDVLHQAGELLSTLTGAAAVVTDPQPERESLAQLRFMPLDASRLLVVLVTRHGGVENRVVDLAGGGDPAELERVNNLIEELLQSDARSLVAVRDALLADIDAERGTIKQLREKARSMIDAAVEREEPAKVRIEGQGRLFDRPEFLDADKIRQYLRAFDDKERLLELLEQTLASGGVRVLIGSETRLEHVDDISLISSPFSGSGSAKGSLGVIGPTRMDYAKVVPLVGFTARVMSEILGDHDVDSEDEGE